MYSVFIFFLLVSFNALSQDKQNQFSVQLISYQNQDKTLGPLVNNGPAFSVGYIRQHIVKEKIGTLKFRFGLASPKSDIEAGRKSVTGNFVVSYGKQQKTGDSGFFLGYSLLASYRSGFYKILDQSHLYWINFGGAALSSSYKKNIGGHSSLYICMELTALGIISRSLSDRLYKVDDPSFSNLLKVNHSSLRLGHIGNYLNPTTELGFISVISDRFSGGIFLRNEYLSSDTKGSLRYQEVQNGAGIRLYIN